MATRRRYKSQQQDPINVAVDEQETAPPDGGFNPPAGEDHLQRALEAQQHAEQLSQQHAHRQHVGLPEPHISPQERQQIDAAVDSIPNLTDHQKRFLKAHPSLMVPPYIDLMRHAILVARHAGVPEDTDQFDRAILVGVARDLEHHRALSALSASARPSLENHQLQQDAHQAAQELHQESEMHRASMAPPAAPTPSRTPPTPRRSIPMSAPVSRDVPSASGHRQQQNNTLSAEEVQIAHNSFSGMSNIDKERSYLAQRERLRKMKSDGTYSEQGGG